MSLSNRFVPAAMSFNVRNQPGWPAQLGWCKTTSFMSQQQPSPPYSKAHTYLRHISSAPNDDAEPLPSTWLKPPHMPCSQAALGHLFMDLSPLCDFKTATSLPTETDLMPNAFVALASSRHHTRGACGPSFFSRIQDSEMTRDVSRRGVAEVSMVKVLCQSAPASCGMSWERDTPEGATRREMKHEDALSPLMLVFTGRWYVDSRVHTHRRGPLVSIAALRTK